MSLIVTFSSAGLAGYEPNECSGAKIIDDQDYKMPPYPDDKWAETRGGALKFMDGYAAIIRSGIGKCVEYTGNGETLMTHPVASWMKEEFREAVTNYLRQNMIVGEHMGSTLYSRYSEPEFTTLLDESFVQVRDEFDVLEAVAKTNGFNWDDTKDRQSFLQQMNKNLSYEDWKRFDAVTNNLPKMTNEKDELVVQMTDPDADDAGKFTMGYLEGKAVPEGSKVLEWTEIDLIELCGFDQKDPTGGYVIGESTQPNGHAAALSQEQRQAIEDKLAQHLKDYETGKNYRPLDELEYVVAHKIPVDKLASAEGAVNYLRAEGMVIPEKKQEKEFSIWHPSTWF